MGKPVEDHTDKGVELEGIAYGIVVCENYSLLLYARSHAYSAAIELISRAAQILQNAQAGHCCSAEVPREGHFNGISPTKP